MKLTVTGKRSLRTIGKPTQVVSQNFITCCKKNRKYKTTIPFELYLSRLMTKPTKLHVRPAKTHISLGIRPVWSESLLCAQWVAKDPSFLHADSEDSDQTGRMPRLIWVFAGRTCHFVGFVTRRLISVFWLQKFKHVLLRFWKAVNILMSRDMTKPTKCVCAQRRLWSECPGWSESSLSTQWVAKDLSFLRLWSDWVVAQADLSLRWTHSHFVGFVMCRLINVPDSGILSMFCYTPEKQLNIKALRLRGLKT